jgi:hypothetical protein
MRYTRSKTHARDYSPLRHSLIIVARRVQAAGGRAASLGGLAADHRRFKFETRRQEMQYYTDGRTTCVDWPATPPSLRSALFTLTPGMTSCGSLAGHWRTTSPSLGQSGSLWLRDHSQTSAVAAKAPRHAAALLKGPLASTAGQRHHPHCAQPYVHCPRG